MSEQLSSGNIGKEITLRGRISRIPWQHLIGMFDGYPMNDYFDIEGGSQIVIYFKESITCTGPVEVRGTVVEVGGGSKRPGKADATYKELHLLVDSWKCIEN